MRRLKSGGLGKQRDADVMRLWRTRQRCMSRLGNRETVLRSAPHIVRFIALVVICCPMLPSTATPSNPLAVYGPLAVEEGACDRESNTL
ncbi:MAG: hypothetical protein D6692_14740, partial [Planctomycetota bacterium]